MPKPVLLQFTFDDSQLAINWHLTRTKCTYGGSGRVYEIHAIHVDPHRRRQFQSQLPSIRLDGVIHVTDDARSLPPRLRKSYTAIYGQRLCNDTTMITDFFRQLMGRVLEVEQRSQIVWQLRIRSIITPKVLKWLAGTIRDYHCQLSPLAPDWTTESDRCKE
jgi:hypothetical protein